MRKRLTDRSPAPSRAACETLEWRTLLSTIVWTNRAVSDGFAIFGTNEARARAIADRAIDDWERVIVNFNQQGGGNTFNVQIDASLLGGNTRSVTNNVETLAGKPVSADVTLDDNGGGTGWYFDPAIGTANLPDDWEFVNLTNRFHASFTGSAGAADDHDFYRSVVHELGHALGLQVGGGLLINNFLTDTNLDDPLDAGSATLVNFNVGGGAVEATLTEAGGGHLYEGLPQGGGTLSHPSELMNHDRALAAPPTTRQLVSDLTAAVLRDAYGYTVAMPSTVNTLYINVDTTNDFLWVGGDPGGVPNTTAIDAGGPGQARLEVNGASEIIPVVEVRDFSIAGGTGNDTHHIRFMPQTWQGGFQGGNGDDQFLVGDGDLDAAILRGFTINPDAGVDSIVFDDSADDPGDDVYKVDRFAFIRGNLGFSIGVEPENVTLLGSPQNDQFDLLNLQPNVRMTLNAGGGNDSFQTFGTLEFSQQGLYVLDGEAGTDALGINDGPDAGNDGYTLTATSAAKHLPNQTTRTFVEFTGFETVALNANLGNNQINLQGAAPGSSIIVNGGGGDNVFNVGNGDIDAVFAGAGGLLQTGGNSTLNFLDAADDPGIDTYTLGVGSFQKGTTGTFNYSGFLNVLVDASRNADVITTSGLGAPTTRIHGNGGADTFQLDGSFNGVSAIVETGAGDDVVHVNADGAGTTPVLFTTSETLGDLNVGAGGLVTVQGGRDKVLRLNNALTLDGRINLNDNWMIHDPPTAPAPLALYAARLTSGYNGGNWLGGEPSIFSTPADATTFSLGYAAAPDLFGGGGGTFAGQIVSERAVLVAFTRYGDANLDGAVNLQDFNRLAANFGGTSTRWSQGNFDYDGTTNLSDFNKLAANFGTTLAPARTPASQPSSRRELDWFDDDRVN
jgi:hypothetical protein